MDLSRNKVNASGGGAKPHGKRTAPARPHSGGEAGARRPRRGGRRLQTGPSTTVVNSRTLWHHALFDDIGGHDGTDGGPEDGQIVDRGTGSGGQSSLRSLCPLRSAPAGPRLSAWLALGG